MPSRLKLKPAAVDGNEEEIDHYQDLIEGTKRKHARFTLMLIAANVLVFVTMLFFGAGFLHSPNNVQLAWGANFGPATEDGQWWRLGTALFLHFGIVHLVMNMLALWDSGRLVERVYGHKRFLLLYLTSGLSGNLLSLIVQGGHAVSGGASGAIFGVYGGLLVFLWRHRKTLNPHEFKWLFWGAAFFSAITLVLGFIITGIDNSAHIGGLVTGIIVGVVLEKPFIHNQHQMRDRLLAFSLFVAVVLYMVAHIQEPAYRWSDELHARAEINKFAGVDAKVTQQWSDIIQQGKKEGASFNEIAGRIEEDVVTPYEQSFDQLSKLQLSDEAPSAETLDNVKRYVELRREASQSLVSGLRANDPVQIRQALELAGSAPQIVKMQADKKKKEVKAK